jgi:hypothetical protein
MEIEHKEQLGNFSPAQFYFNAKYGKNKGKCIICRRDTKFNETTEKYERICDRKDTKCREVYRKLFMERMKKAGKENQMTDPEHQKKMLAGRKISGTYKWSTGDYEFKYTGSYERDFLEFLDLVMSWDNPSDIMLPAPQIFKYKGKDGKEHFYIPDVYITSLNLIVEIKSAENKHYRLRDIEIENLKDDILGNSGYNYIKILDKNYSTFFNYLIERKKESE